LGAFGQHFTDDGEVVLEVVLPAIAPSFFDSTVYLYPSEVDATDGTALGGSGFIVAVPSRHADLTPYLRVVTNRHVVEDGRCRFVRFKGRTGDAVIMQTHLEHWVRADDDDLAVMGFGIPKEIEWHAISTDIFLDENCEVEGWPVLPGDEVFFFGRFITHDGRQRNKPVVRFGNVSMLPDPDALVKIGGDREQLAFLVECRSLSGFSGSPALVKLEGSRLTDEATRREGRLPRTLRLMGVDCAHLPFWSPLRERRDHETVIKDRWVETNSGIAAIVPAWRLLRLLNSEQLMAEREEAERKRGERQRKASVAVPDVAIATEPGFTETDFLDALKRVSRKQSDEKKSLTSVPLRTMVCNETSARPDTTAGTCD
jgi:hypothetical protein